MAFKFTVDHQTLSLVVETDATEPTTTFVYAKPSVTYQSMQAMSAYELAALSDIYLDPDSLNRYFTAQMDSPNALTVTMSEAISSINSSLSKADTYSLEDVPAKAVAKALADSATVSEALAVAFSSVLSDSSTLSDSPAKSITVARADTYSMSESSVWSVSLAPSDAFALDDLSSVSDVLKTDVELVKNNVATLTEALAFSLS